jgi:hypothetical protein
MVFNNISYFKINCTKIFFRLFLFIILIFLFIIIGKFIYEPLNLIFQIIYQHTIFFLLMRWAVIISITYFWPVLITTLGNYLKISHAKILYWKNEKYRISLWLILFELLVCENIIFKLFFSI